MGFEPMKDVSPPLTDYQSAPISPPLARLRFDKRVGAQTPTLQKKYSIKDLNCNTRHLTKRAVDLAVRCA